MASCYEIVDECEMRGDALHRNYKDNNLKKMSIYYIYIAEI